MTFPAYDQLGNDIRVGFPTWRVYMYLRRNCLNHVKPVEVKAWLLVTELHMSWRSVVKSLNWLVQEGYLIEHGRAERRVRILTLAWDVQPIKPPGELKHSA